MSSPDQLKKTSSADYGGHKFEKDVLALRKKPQASRKFINPKIVTSLQTTINSTRTSTQTHPQTTTFHI